jgi:hypothetical protein
VPQVVAPPVEVHNPTVVKEVSLDVAPVADPRDAKIASLETALQSLQSALEKVQSAATASTNKQHSNSPVKRPFPHKAAVVEMSGEAALLPAGTHRQMNQMTAYCNEFDATMCSFIFRMQERNFENHQFTQQRAIENYQFAQQRTIERLELENFLHSRR